MDKTKSYVMKTVIKSFFLIIIIIGGCTGKMQENYIMTVKGHVEANKTGIWLTHEHILVDFIDADSITPGRYNRSEVINKTLPFLRTIKELGCKTFVECTPQYLGRDIEILRALSDSTGMNILTNTGFYGANNNRYIPSSVMSMSPEQMAEIWIGEWEKGIGETGIKPGFIKISVDPGPLSDFHAKLVKAAAMTHLKTGLTIASHTGPAVPAFQEIELLKEYGVDPSAFIWVHASGEKDYSKIVEAAKQGTWISIDNLNDNNVQEVIDIIQYLKEAGHLGRVLVSHDAGYYDPSKEDGGSFRPLTTLFEKLIPELKLKGFSDSEIKQLIEKNPIEAFTVKIRKIKH